MEQSELLRRMWGRVDLCRRLAITTTDPHTANALIQMANEGDADIRRLMADRDMSASLIPPTPGARRVRQASR
ncbi:hypothetical protein ACGGKE_16070 (plasmid) [Sphingobium naphthae]|uniref:hypothetical protein n=1 Tax=Sphingobium naphthae TaxID=1886786 RepID=UPI003748388A